MVSLGVGRGFGACCVRAKQTIHRWKVQLADPSAGKSTLVAAVNRAGVIKQSESLRSRVTCEKLD
jgi:predicted ATPase